MKDNYTVHHFSSGVYAKQMKLPAQHEAKTHKHKYDHLSILAQGEVAVLCNGEVTQYKAPTAVTIKAGVEHSIYAHTDSVWFCVHATDETDLEHIDEVLIEHHV